MLINLYCIVFIKLLYIMHHTRSLFSFISSKIRPSEKMQIENINEHVTSAFLSESRMVRMSDSDFFFAVSLNR